MAELIQTCGNGNGEKAQNSCGKEKAQTPNSCADGQVGHPARSKGQNDNDEPR
jgi:hypothetical protein